MSKLNTRQQRLSDFLVSKLQDIAAKYPQTPIKYGHDHELGHIIEVDDSEAGSATGIMNELVRLETLAMREDMFQLVTSVVASESSILYIKEPIATFNMTDSLPDICYDVENFTYNGKTIKPRPGRANFTAKFKSWTTDPGIALCVCSDGKERQIPTMQLIGFETSLYPEQKVVATIIGEPSNSYQ